jgi:hypothetical protein
MVIIIVLVLCSGIVNECIVIFIGNFSTLKKIHVLDDQKS